MGEPLVHAEGAGKVFGRGDAAVVALREATFEIYPGDRIGLVGPSGSGKTTLLHLIAALDAPSEGRIEWPGLGPPEGLRPGLVGVAFQGPSLLPPLTVEENVAMPQLLSEVPAVDAVAAAGALIDRLGLEDVAAKLPEELSGGQMQRAGVARALVGGPRLILADEPTGQLDRETGGALLDVVLEQAAITGAALVIATHDLAVADRLPIRWALEDRRLKARAILRSA